MINTYEEKISAQISNAIARSEANDTIVAVKIDGDSGDALAAIAALEKRCEYAMLDREGSDLLDVWGLVWRLNISFVQN